MGTCPTEIAELRIESVCSNIISTEFTLDSLDKIVVYGYIRLKIENEMKEQIIPYEILLMISSYFGYNAPTNGDKILIKSSKTGRWNLNTIDYNKLPSQTIPEHLRSHLSSSQRKIYSHQLHYKQGLHYKPTRALDMKDIKIGDIIDSRNLHDRWYVAEIKYIKSSDELINANNPYINEVPFAIHGRRLADIAKFQKISAIVVDYGRSRWPVRYEWIFMWERTICSCSDAQRCHNKEHRLAVANTQSCRDGHEVNDSEWLFIESDIICDCDDIELCGDPMHKISLQL